MQAFLLKKIYKALFKAETDRFGGRRIMFKAGGLFKQAFKKGKLSLKLFKRVVTAY